jgi:hypothetical protein
MKNLTYLFLLLLFVACEKEETNGVPTFITIDAITLDEENATANITDAWVYINDQLQGVYELPAQFPVLHIGAHKLRVKAGIKDNGIASSRIPYPFYGSYIQEEVEFVENEDMTLTPLVNYLEGTTFFIEDFEGVGLGLETTNISDTIITQITEGSENYGAGFLTDSLITFEIATNELEDLPQAGAPVYLELDYKCNTQFLVGVYINYSQSVVQKDLLWINPKEDWNKIYVNLTSTISEGINASSFKVFIGMKRDSILDTNELYFDNLKVVY